MEGLKQDIAEIDSAIIVARQWHKEAKTEQDASKHKYIRRGLFTY